MASRIAAGFQVAFFVVGAVPFFVGLGFIYLGVRIRELLERA